MRQRGFALFLVIIIVVLVGIVGCVFLYKNNVFKTNVGSPQPTTVQMFQAGVEPKTVEEPALRQAKDVYFDEKAGFKLVFPGTMFIERGPELGYINSNLRHGMIKIGRTSNFGTSGIQIEYGTPELGEKGGGCPSEPGPSSFVLGGAKATSSCFAGSVDTSYPYFIGYPKNPYKSIEYAIFIDGNSKEKEEYLEIIKNGLTWVM